MPQLRLFNRRWRLASDTLPIMGEVFSFFHLIVFIPTISLFLVAEGDSYSCSEKTIVRVALYGTIICNGIAFLHDLTMIPVGLRGGPLEEYKRRLMPGILYSRLCIYIVATAFSIFSTIVVYNPNVEHDCWTSSPCEKIENVCNGTEVTQPCMVLYEESGGTINSCREDWFNLAATFAVSTFNESTKSYDWSTLNSAPGCNVSTSADSAMFRNWAEANNQSFPSYYNELNSANNGISRVWMGIMGIQASNPGAEAPWSSCLSPLCYTIAKNFYKCPQYQDLIQFGSSNSHKATALSVVYATWAIQILVALVFLLAFNAFPNYSEVDSWTSFVKNWSRFMCCSNVLMQTKTEGGESAAEGLGELLYKIFGGIDLDPTDQILGFYLVMERQRWRRQLGAIQTVEDAGYAYSRPRRFWRKGFALPPAFKARKILFNEEEAKLEPDMEGPVGNIEALEPFSCLPRERMELPHGARDDSFVAPHIYHSFIRLDSELVDVESQTQGSLQSNADTSSDERQVPGNAKGSRLTGNSRGIKFVLEERVLLTPVNFGDGIFSPPLTAVEAANVYIGKPPQHVEKEMLETVLSYSWLAKAAYGLQTERWKGAKSGNVFQDGMDAFVNFSKPVVPRKVVKSHFKKRNMAAILKYTGVQPSDILHVSYTSTALGSVPYLVLLHRNSKSVVVSIRGTVGLADLVTDLLSNPVDASQYMPQWVISEIEKEICLENSHVGTSDEMYAHAGILSSAKAVLKDLEDKDLIKAMLNVSTDTDIPDSGKNVLDIVSEENQNIHDEYDKLSDDGEVHLPLSRAHSVMHEAVVSGGWDVVITGHSLGAAVASMISFHLHAIFPKLRCYAFNPPGGLMSPKLSQLSQTFCTSVVVGFDAISRLSLRNTRRVVDDMVLALGRCKRPKLAILADIALGRRKNPASTPPTYCSFEDIGDEALESLKEYVQTSALHKRNIDDRPLFPPGKIAFLRPFATIPNGKYESWDAIWVSKEDLMDEGILLNKRLVRDHQLFTVQEAVNSALVSLQTSQLIDRENS